MGDRGNIVIRQGTTTADDVWFYTHWSGSEIGAVVKNALSRNQRWNDASYLARIVFCELVKGSEADETGFGISCSIGDNEHDVLVVDVPRQVVFTIAESALADGRLPEDASKRKGKSFSEYIN